MSPIKQFTGKPDFSYRSPEDYFLNKTASTKQDINKLLNAYKVAMQTLEDSVADVAISHPESIAFANTLSDRIFTFIEKYAEVSLEPQDLSPNAFQRKAQIDLKMNEILVSIFSCKISTAKGLIETGIDNEAGNVGTNPLAIRKAFKEGNLREKMYIIYKTNWNFTHEIFIKPELLNKINAKLTTYQVDSSVFPKAHAPYDYGLYAKQTSIGELRIKRSPEEVEKMRLEKNLTINATNRRIPLSERELRHATKELNPDSSKLSTDLRNMYHYRAKEKIGWTSGSCWFQPISNNGRTHKNDYLAAVESIYAPSLAGISGTTDLILTMSLYFGMSSRKELETARLGCLGVMLDNQDHTVAEIMVASKSFGLDYELSPDCYKYIFSQDMNFIKKLEEAQNKKGSDLPDRCLLFLDK